MKRALVISLMCVVALTVATLFSVSAFAGWKFGAEQGVDVGGGNYPLEAYFGYDFYVPFVDMGPLSIAGDLVLSRAFDWATSFLSGVVMVDGELVFSHVNSDAKKDADLVLFLGGEIDYAELPEYFDILDAYGGVELIGYVNAILELSGGVNLLYDPAGDKLDAVWFVGFDAAW